MRKIGILVLSIVILASCGKFEEGPKFSLRSVKNRMEGEWTLEKYSVEGEDLTETYLDGKTEEWRFDGDFTLKYTDRSTEQITGTWEISDNLILIELKMKTPDGLQYFEQDTLPLTRLTNQEMWVKYENGIEKHYKSK